MVASDYPAMWGILVMVRLVWVFLPQFGYIHPDEFFQSTEIVAGDVLGLEVHRPWEFRGNSPLRSITLPYAISAPGFYILKWLSSRGFFPDPLATPSYWLLIAPRLIMVITSITMDILVGKTAKNFGIGPRSVLLCYASSYVTLVYHSRTFTNSLESFFFSAFLYNFSKSSPWKPRSKQTRSGGNMAMALILVAGTFNRPTFLGFAMMPLLSSIYWKPKETFRQVYELAVYSTTFILLFVIADTLYYRDISLPTLFEKVSTANSWTDILLRVLTITPLNFILYNVNSSNLAEHGTHSRITHSAVNFPMLFGPCALIVYGHTVLVFKNTKRRSSREFLVTSALLPMLFLSLFPHQEPRFLVPLITPIALLCGSKIFAKTFTWNVVRILWILFNVTAAFVFGFLHQGGVTRSLIYLQNRMNQDIRNSIATGSPFQETHIMYFHTYMPPGHLMAKPISPEVKSKKYTDQIHIHDMKGASQSELQSKIQYLGNTSNPRVLVVTPHTVGEKLCQSHSFNIKSLHSFSCHLSFEDPPDLWSLWNKPTHERTHFMQKIFSSLSLNVMEVELQ